MASEKIVSHKVQKAILKTFEESLKKEIPFLLFNEMLDMVRSVLKIKIGRKDLREAIGALKSNGKISSKKVAGREIYYLSDIVEKYRNFLLKKNS